MRKCSPLRVREWGDKKYERYPHSNITHKIIGCAIDVHKNLGPGFKESAYENALVVEFERRQLNYERQQPVSVNYRGKQVGTYRMDLIVEHKVIVELKCVASINAGDADGC